MKIRDLIKNKDYDYIEWRVALPDSLGGDDIFFGSCKSEKGKLISLDGDSYDEDVEAIEHREWSSVSVEKGLTVICKEEWV